jgi:hypothetical protein
MTDLTLEREMRRVLLALEMTSAGCTASYDANGGGAFASAPPKSGDHHPPHIRYREQWNETFSDTTRRQILERAKDELDAIQHTRAGQGSETEEERTKRLLRQGEGFDPREVALSFKMTETQVRRTRLRHGRTAEKGLVDPMQPMPDATPSERRERARLLRDEHRMSTRQIGILLGVDHSTIVRDLSYRGDAKAA